MATILIGSTIVLKKDRNLPIALLSAAQNLTGSWADLGNEIDCRDTNAIAIYLNLDVNDSQNMRIKALAKHTAGGSDEYELPIKTVSATDVKVVGEYIEFNSDADQKVVLEVELNDVIPFIQFQVQAGVAGATPGQVDDAKIIWKHQAR